MGHHGTDPAAREERFRRIYANHFATVLGYALRRASSDGRLSPVVSGSLPDGWTYGDVSSLPIVSLGYDRRVQYQGDPVNGSARQMCPRD